MAVVVTDVAIYLRYYNDNYNLYKIDKTKPDFDIKIKFDFNNYICILVGVYMV